MAGIKRRKRLKLLFAATRDNTRESIEEKQDIEDLSTWSDLPAELLELILSLLNLRENVRVSAVCKRWNTIAASVLLENQPPWIMYFPKSGHLYDFYDPLTRKTYSTELPELCGSRICYTQGVWLLLYKSLTQCLFFFNPFSRESIKLPRFEITCQIVGFSCDPTSSACVVFTLRHVSPTVVAISTCCPGETEWTTTNHPNRLPFVSSVWNKFVFSRGKFYCLSLTGWLGVFDPKKRSWNVLVVPPPKCPVNFFTKNWWKCKFLAEHNGDIMVIYACRSDHPIIYKLDRSSMAWEKANTLDGITIFVNSLSSHSRTYLPGPMRNNIYFPKVRYYGKRCISYSLADCRYYPRKEFHDWGEYESCEAFWIDPPHDLPPFM